jgi:hypothetical protein
MSEVAVRADGRDVLWPSLSLPGAGSGLHFGQPMERAAVARDPASKLSYISCVGRYSSSKMSLRFPFESLPECEAMILLDVDPEVEKFASQPETFRWSEAGKSYRYTPDFLVTFFDGRREYREVKPDDWETRDATLKGRREGIVRECARRGASFGIWTRSSIRREPRLSVAKRLRSGSGHLDPATVDRIRNAVTCVGLPATLGMLVRAAGGDLHHEGAILGLAGLGYLALDPNRHLHPDTVVSAGARR